MQLINNLEHQPQQYQHSYFRSTIVLLLALVMVCDHRKIWVKGTWAFLLPFHSAARTAPQSVPLLEQRQKPGQVQVHDKDPGASPTLTPRCADGGGQSPSGDLG